MKKGQTSRRANVQDVLCPFIYVAVTQGADGSYSHRGTKACDIGYKIDVYEPYYAPCDIKCVWTYPDNGQAMWQTLQAVRLADGTIDYLTFVTAHDSSFDAEYGQIVKQGEKWGNKGIKGANGYHCHIECARGQFTVYDWKTNQYGIWCMPNEIDIDSVFFMDNTEIETTDQSKNAKWKYLKDVPVSENNGKRIYLPANVDTWAMYKLGVKPIKGNQFHYLAPSQYGGLNYEILEYSQPNVAVIQTEMFGKVQIYIGNDTPAIIK